MQDTLHKRATNYRAPLRKMTYKDKAFHECSPPCNISTLILSVYTALLSVYRALLSVCRTLLGVYRANFISLATHVDSLHITYESVITRMNESRHICQRHMGRID